MQSSRTLSSRSVNLQRSAALLLAVFAAISVQGAELQTLEGNVPKPAQLLRPTGQLPATNRVDLAIALPLRNAAALSNLLQQIYDPHSPLYRHYLTPEQFTENFGRTEQDYQAVINFAKANHLKVTGTHPNRLLLDVSGSVADVESTLHVTLNSYQHPTEGRSFYAPDREPSLNLSVPILHIGGLDNYALPKPHLQATRIASGHNAKPNAGSGPSGTYMGKDFRAAYVPDSTLNGSGQTVGLLEFDGYTASDITYYETSAHLQKVPLRNVLLDGFSGAPTGDGGEVEVSLDIEVAISMATNLSAVVVYEAGPFGSWHDMLNRMANDNVAKQLSCSWYIPGGVADPVADQIFQQMEAQGQSFFNASGDSDAYTGLIDFPGDTPYITQVGGTTLTTTGPGGAWAAETVWNWGTEYGENGVGSSGGISTQYPIPTWQANINMAANQGSTTMRNTPDVALTADNVYVRADGGNFQVGGTSCAAPLWAGFAALANQQAVGTRQPLIGFINPAVDAIASGVNYSTTFHDISTGNNTSSSSPNKFYAVAGYDLCTGWGVPAGQHLINALANPEALIISPTSGFSVIGGVGGPFFPVASQSYSLTNIGTNTLTWTLSITSAWLSASSGSGALLPGGPAAATTVSLNNTASNLPAGNYNATIWFTNQNDNVGQNRQFTLSVISPPTITQQPADDAVLESAPATFSVQTAGGLPLNYQWQYNGTNLTDGSHISGSATSTLTISDVSAANVGAYSVVVTNFAGTATSSNAWLAITPSAPVIVTQPTNSTIAVGTTAEFAVQVVGTTPIFYQWTFNGTNLINQTNALLTWSDAQFSDNGSYAVLVTNTLGSILSSNATLTVVPCDPVPAGIAHWWPAEGNAYDLITGVSGIVELGATFTNGMVGQCFSFDGVTGCVLNDNTPSLTNIQDSFTIEFWAYPRGNMTFYAPTPGDLNNGGGLQLAVFPEFGGSGGQAGVGVGVGTNGIAVIEHAYNYLPVLLNYTNFLNGWTHVALVYSNKQPVLYVNGAEVATGITSPRTFVYPSKDFGSETTSPWNTYGPYNGLLDEVSIYNRELTPGEIAAIYAAGSGGKCFTPTLPVITVEPTNQTVAIDGTANFSVLAGGTPPLSYQWSFNNTNLAGATNAALVLTNVQVNQSGNYSVLVSNPYGSVTSSIAVLTVYVTPPFITEQPGSQTNAVGTTASFSVAAGGTAPLSYQWSFNNTNLVGATSATLTLTDVQLNQSGNYSVLITNAYGSTNSSIAVLTVYAVPPFITGQPSNQTNFVGTTASFSVTAGGTAPLTYQWSFNDSNLAGATNATLVLSDLQLDQSGDYSVLIANAYGSTNSGIAVLTVNPALPCEPPPSGIVDWWQADGNAFDFITGVSGVVEPGASFTNGMVGECFSFNGTDGCVLNDNTPSLTNIQDSFTIEFWAFPQGNMVFYPIGSGYVNNGGGLQLAVFPDNGGSGGPAGAGIGVGTNGIAVIEHAYDYLPTLLNYTNSLSGWVHVALVYSNKLPVLYVNGAQVATGITSSRTFVYPSKDLGGSLTSPWNTYGPYQGLLDEVSIYNRVLAPGEIAAIYAAGSGGKCFAATSPIITGQPASETNAVGTTASFSVTAGGTPPLSYQWSFNNTNLVGATNANLVLANVQVNQSGDYSVLITNAYGSTNSSIAVLTVYAIPPFITGQPASQSNAVGTTASFSVTAGGTAPLTYQWSFNDTNLAGATSNTLVLANLQLNQSGNYSVLVSSPYGSTNSSIAVLTVYAIPPFIAGQPASQTDAVGTTASFSVAAGGTPPLSYQWSFNNTNLAGATSATLVLTNVQFTQTGDYSALVSSPYGSTTSSIAVLTVSTAPSCDAPPTGIVAWWPAEGNAEDILNGISGVVEPGTTFTNGMVGQCFSFNGTDGCVLNDNTPSLTNIQNSFTTEFWAYPQGKMTFYTPNPGNLNNGGGMQLAVFPEYGGTGGQAGVGIGVGTNGISVMEHASDYLPVLLNYTNFLNGWTHVALVYSNKQSILYVNGVRVATGITSPRTFVYPSKDFGGETTYPWDDYGPYKGLLDEVSIYNRVLTSAEIAAIYNAGSGGKCPPSAPFIATQPTNQTVAAGSSVSFSVVAAGSSPLSYQWKFDGTNITWATNPTLTLTNAQLVQAGSYSVLVTNAYGSATSSNALLIVDAAPVFVNQPTNLTVNVGSTAVFAASVTGSLPASYQWTFNQTNLLPGMTNASLVLSNVQLAQGGVYALTVTNLFGAAFSSNATLTVVDVLDHFIWNTIPSPRFANAPFGVTIQAMDPANQLLTNFNGTALLTTTNGVPVQPPVSTSFSQGVWMGTLTISQPVPNLVLLASDGAGHMGSANSINLVNVPAIQMGGTGNSLLLLWPMNPAGFELVSTTNLVSGPWTPVTVPPVPIGNQYLESIQLNGTNQFYRLQYTLP